MTALKKLDKRLSRVKSNIQWRWRRCERFCGLTLKLATFWLSTRRLPASLNSVNGKRFLEVAALIEEFLAPRLKDPDQSKAIAYQLLNVLKNCDEITYEEEGTAEAYALLHFLDRYHRFQLIFASLSEKGLMPTRANDLKILDVGTGPGPSMFAASDFYTRDLGTNLRDESGFLKFPFSIDYVERSSQFRNWLHHFTEFTNYYAPTQKPWAVPYQHGTFLDFKNLDFNQKSSYFFQNDDGESEYEDYVIRHRFDLVVFSNFLTTKEQTLSFSKEIEDCARFLRNNGLLVVVGAKSSSKKYNEVYSEIINIVTAGRYSTKKYFAECKKIDIGDPSMRYSWGDEHGQVLKRVMKNSLDNLHEDAKPLIPRDFLEMLNASILPQYNRSIEWELMVFRKQNRPRRRPTNPQL